MPADVPRPVGGPQTSGPAGLPQHFPPQSLPMQQHNILGQAFIELRHRVPDGRPRLPFPVPPGGALEGPPAPRHGAFMPRPDLPGPRLADPLRRPPQSLPHQLPVHPSLDQAPPPHPEQGHPAHSSVVMRSLSHPLGGEFPETPLSTCAPAETPSGSLQVAAQPADGLEEKLDSDDPSVKELDVKDLEGVEVKDLDDEDLENLNLDADDGKADDLDTLESLEANDPHLDDLLRSGEFDILAYADPELDLGGRKGVFHEELDLGVPVGDKPGGQCVSAEPKSKEQEGDPGVPSDTASPWKKPAIASDIKTEVPSPPSEGEARCERESGEMGQGHADTPCSQAAARMDGGDGADAAGLRSCEAELLDGRPPRDAAAPGPGAALGPPQQPAEDAVGSCGVTGSAPVLSGLLANEKSEGSDLGPLGSPPPALPASPSSHVSSLPPALMTPPGPLLDSSMSPSVTVVPRVNHAFPQGVQVNPGFLQGPSAVNHGFGTGKPASQAVPLPSQPGPQPLMVPPALAQQGRERPLLLEEQPLLLQDLLDQERQEQQQQRQMQAMIRQRSEPFFPNVGRAASRDGGRPWWPLGGVACVCGFPVHVPWARAPRPHFRSSCSRPMKAVTGGRSSRVDPEPQHAGAFLSLFVVAFSRNRRLLRGVVLPSSHASEAWL